MRVHTGAVLEGADSAAHDGQPAGIGTTGYRRRQRRHSNAVGTAIGSSILDGRSRPRSTSTVIYCVIPPELEHELLDRMQAYYANNPNVEVILDRRVGGASDRRRERAAGPDERRVVRDRRRARIAGTFPRIDAPEEV